MSACLTGGALQTGVLPPDAAGAISGQPGEEYESSALA